MSPTTTHDGETPALTLNFRGVSPLLPCLPCFPWALLPLETSNLKNPDHIPHGQCAA